MSNSDHYLSEYYNQKCEKYGQSHKAVGWISRKTQQARYNLLTPYFAQDTSSILDIGCGQGDFLTHLNTIGWSGYYTGIDLSNNMIEIAQATHPTAHWMNQSIEKIDVNITADWVVAFGTFSLRTDSGKLPKIRQHFTQLFQRAHKTAVFNGLSTFAKDAHNESSKFAYFDPMQLLSIALTLTPSVQLIHGTLENDLTLLMHHSTDSQ